LGAGQGERVALRFSQHEDVVYDDAPLIMVLSQVKFPRILSLLTQAGVAGFQAGLRDDYPIMLDPAQSAKVEFSSHGPAKAEVAAPTWRFTDDARGWVVGVAADFVSLETSRYVHIDEFLERFSMILEVARRVLRPAESLRIGLRKINMFEVPGRDTLALLKIIRPELLGPLSTPEYPAPITGYASQLHFADEDNGLTVTCGLADTEGKQDVTRFALDLDYFTGRPYPVAGADSVIELLRHFSVGITSFFHWAVTADYLQTLGPRPRGKEHET
jgi:uncharacterized protein (TIGR04255 family)